MVNSFSSLSQQIESLLKKRNEMVKSAVFDIGHPSFVSHFTVCRRFYTEDNGPLYFHKHMANENKAVFGKLRIRFDNGIIRFRYTTDSGLRAEMCINELAAVQAITLSGMLDSAFRHLFDTLSGELYCDHWKHVSDDTIIKTAFICESVTVE